MNTLINQFKADQAKDNNLAYGLTVCAAAAAVFGAALVSMAQGKAVSKAVEAIGKNPEAMSKIRSVMIIGLAIVETGSIYCFLIALMLIFS